MPAAITTTTAAAIGKSAPGAHRFKARRLQVDDYDHGFLELLSELTTTGPISKATFLERYNQMSPSEYKVVVVVDGLAGNRIVAAGTLFIEKKFIHECGTAGHIEDVVVGEAYRGWGLGRTVVEELVAAARQDGCYKVILDCGERNVAFYEKCGFARKEVQMAFYL